MRQRHTDPDTRKARILDRRAARSRRSKWLGRLLFTLSGTGLLLLLRLNPGFVEEVMVSMSAPAQSEEAAAFHAPDAVQVHRMPKDAVPVRRGGALPHGTSAQHDTQAQADAVANTLRALRPGG